MDPAVEVGTEITIVLRLAQGWSDNDTIRIPGIVMWCRRDEESHRIGARFAESLADKLRQKLAIIERVLDGELDFDSKALEPDDS